MFLELAIAEGEEVAVIRGSGDEDGDRDDRGEAGCCESEEEYEDEERGGAEGLHYYYSLSVVNI